MSSTTTWNWGNDGAAIFPTFSGFLWAWRRNDRASWSSRAKSTEMWLSAWLWGGWDSPIGADRLRNTFLRPLVPFNSGGLRFGCGDGGGRCQIYLSTRAVRDEVRRRCDSHIFTITWRWDIHSNTWRHGGRTGVSLWTGDGGRTSMVRASCFLVLLLFGFSMIRHGGEVGVLEQLPVSGRIYILLYTHIIKDRWSPWKQACASNHRDT